MYNQLLPDTFRDFDYFSHFSGLSHQGSTTEFAYIFGVRATKKHNFLFPESFRCFRLNKSVLEIKETKQADSQLWFPPKIINIHLLVFENELIEDAMLVPKKSQT